MKNENEALGRVPFNLSHLSLVLLYISTLLWGMGNLLEVGPAPGAIGNYGNVYKLILMPTAFAVGCISLLLNIRSRKPFSVTPILLFVLFTFFAFLSALILEKNNLYSIWKSFELFAMITVVVSLGSHSAGYRNVSKAYHIFFGLNAIMLIMVFINGLIFPSLAFAKVRSILPWQVSGVYPNLNPNTIGFMSAIAALTSFQRFVAARSLPKRMFFVLSFGFFFIMLLLAQARTSLLALFIGISFLLLANKKFLLVAMLSMFAFCAVLFTNFTTVAEEYVRRGQSQTLLTSMSGRTVGWAMAWNAFKESPIIGKGYAAAARADILGAAGASTMHGSVFDVLVGVGLTGFFPWFMSIVTAVWRVLTLKIKSGGVYLPDREFFLELKALVIMILIRSLTSSALGIYDHGMLLFFIIFMYASLRSRDLARKEMAL